MVEHATENRGVGSSTLPLGTCESDLGRTGGSGAVVARLLAKEKVAGSNPVFRSISFYPSPPLSNCHHTVDPNKTPVLQSSNTAITTAARNVDTRAAANPRASNGGRAPRGNASLL